MKNWLIPHPNVPNAEFGDAHLKRVTTLFNENFAKLDALMQAAQASVSSLASSKSNDGHKHDEDYAQLEHKHVPDDVTGLSDLLANKANLNHEHAQYLTEITAHQHETNEINGLLEALNGKAPTAHGHTFADIDGLDDLSASAARTAYVDQRDIEKLAAANAYTDAAISEIDVPEASSLTPYKDTEDGATGTAESFARGDHQHPLNYPEGKPTTSMKRDGAGTGGTASFGTTKNYADLGHSHPLDVPTSTEEIAFAKEAIAFTKDGMGSDTDNGAALGATSFYARLDHIHALNVDTDIPPDISVSEGSVGDSGKYAQSNHTHKMPTFAASKWMKTDGNGNVSTTNEQPIALDASSNGLVFNNNGSLSYKSIGSGSGQIADGTHTHAYGSASLTGFGTAAASNASDFAPSNHAHGNITSDGKLNGCTSADCFVVTTTNAVITHSNSAPKVSEVSELVTQWKNASKKLGAVTSVCGKTGSVTLDHSDVGAAATNHTHTTGDVSDFSASVQSLISSALESYATQSWVTSQLSGKASQSEVDTISSSLESLTEIVQQIQADYVTSGDLQGYATQQWVQSQGYVTEEELGEYLTTDDISQASINALASGVSTATIKVVSEVTWNGTTLQYKYKNIGVTKGIITNVPASLSTTPIDTPTVITWN